MKIRVIASEKNWIEGNALDQLKKTAQLPGVIDAVGMPDLHPGKDAPVGAVFATRNHIYPHLVGTDIGCGIALWQLKLKLGKLNVDKLARRLGNELEGPWEGDVAEFLRSESVDATSFDEHSSGTIGSGNHFVEVQRVHSVFDEERFSELGLDGKSLYLLVHSGSRGFGESILDAHVARFGNVGLAADSEEASGYVNLHNHASGWARANRKLIGIRFMSALGTDGRQVVDVPHNHVVPGIINSQPCWLHRKGAAPTNMGPVVIAGSRGTLSYLVEGTGDQAANLATIAHGAGRKWRRSECRARLEGRFSPADLLKTELGSRVICEDKDLLYEEAPQAYKNIDVVIQDLIDAGLIRTIASFAAILTYKKRMIRR